MPNYNKQHGSVTDGFDPEDPDFQDVSSLKDAFAKLKEKNITPDNAPEHADQIDTFDRILKFHIQTVMREIQQCREEWTDDDKDLVQLKEQVVEASKRRAKNTMVPKAYDDTVQEEVELRSEAMDYLLLRLNLQIHAHNTFYELFSELDAGNIRANLIEAEQKRLEKEREHVEELRDVMFDQAEQYEESMESMRSNFEESVEHLIDRVDEMMESHRDDTMAALKRLTKLFLESVDEYHEENVEVMETMIEAINNVPYDELKAFVDEHRDRDGAQDAYDKKQRRAEITGDHPEDDELFDEDTTGDARDTNARSGAGTDTADQSPRRSQGRQTAPTDDAGRGDTGSAPDTGGGQEPEPPMDDGMDQPSEFAADDEPDMDGAVESATPAYPVVEKLEAKIEDGHEFADFYSLPGVVQALINGAETPDEIRDHPEVKEDVKSTPTKELKKLIKDDIIEASDLPGALRERVE